MMPEKLTTLPRWVRWRFETRDGKRTKVPIALDGRRASSTDPSTWATYLEVKAAPRLDGIGFVFADGDGIVGIDLDHHVRDGELDDLARAFVDAFASYTEISPSGSGVHIIIRAEMGDGRRDIRRGIEIYGRGRYFTMTGDHVTGTPLTVEDRQVELDALLADIDGTRRKTAPIPEPVSIDATDEALIERAMRAGGGAGDDFIAAFLARDERFGGDVSVGDWHLVRAARFWTGADPARMDAWYRQSRRCRAKWDERRGAQSYGELTIRRALEAGGDVYRPRVKAAR